jgi:DNA-binding response OmpR family regulator
MAQTVLIAAHDPWFLQLLRMYTEESGFKAVQVYEGQDVLPMIRLEQPVAVLLQVDLPGHMKSWDVLKCLQDERGMSEVPVLVFTWHDQALPADYLLNVAAHLQEPVTFEAFVDAFQKLGLHPAQARLNRAPPKDRSRPFPKDAH